MHSQRHTMFTRLGKSGIDAFTILRIGFTVASRLRSEASIQARMEVERAFESSTCSATSPKSSRTAATRYASAGGCRQSLRACSSTVRAGDS